MKGLFVLFAGVITLGLYFVAAPVIGDSYRRYRGRKTVICPEAGRLADIEVKAGQAGLMSAFGKRWVRVKRCSLWRGKKSCSQECVAEDSPSLTR